MTEPHLEHSIFGGHQDERDDPRAVVRSRAEVRRQGRPPRRRGRRLGILVVALAIVAAAGIAAYTVLRPVVDGLLESNDYPGPGSGKVEVVVNDGDSGRAIARTLEKADVVKTTKAYLDAAARDKRASAIQPGSYTLKKQMRAQDALAVLVNPANRDVPRVTIREGLWKSEVFAALSKGTGLPVEAYQAAAKDPAALGLPAAAKGNLEGWLFPSTYEFPTKATATEQLRTMVAKTVAELDKAGVAEEQRQRVLIVASIVEGEARGDADRGKVARVVENRMDNPKGPTVGFIQMDSTVNYALQKRGNLTKAEYDRAKSSPYDSYANKGLPPGPIGNPGAAAIEAAAHPTEGPWFYFVTVNLDTGETLFATTLAEQHANEAKLQAWCAPNPGKCSGGG
jgi:UPF0755 protein